MNKEQEILFAVLERPGLYVGKNRLDYVGNFFSGFTYHAGLSPDNKLETNFNYPMQKWLFYKESVSIAHSASINGWSVLSRCYGNNEDGCNKLKEFLQELWIENTISDSEDRGVDDTVGCHIYQIYRYYHWKLSSFVETFSFEVSKDYYPVSERIKKWIGEIEYSYESLIPLIRKMVDEPFDRLKIYLHYDRYFLQVRFLYYSESNGWIDNVELIDKDDYYLHLTILHAYTAIIQREEHPSHVITIEFENNEISINYKGMEDYWYKIFNEDLDKNYASKEPMAMLYNEWKANVV
ncbi:hypothetical protein [Breznakia pachnodae]|uniref:DUF3885 domain-containing protein n=1 Tax=Breznakia pachnodae TaxID=265178 RepID=A0ABU0E638_9FIRM|nr:hypothetical protein [Breznakia pachnodae]MDQ0362276.1 hypothetical protein [Breznakia pachnodae]